MSDVVRIRTLGEYDGYVTLQVCGLNIFLSNIAPKEYPDYIYSPYMTFIQNLFFEVPVVLLIGGFVDDELRTMRNKICWNSEISEGILESQVAFYNGQIYDGRPHGTYNNQLVLFSLNKAEHKKNFNILCANGGCALFGIPGNNSLLVEEIQKILQTCLKDGGQLGQCVNAKVVNGNGIAFYTGHDLLDCIISIRIDSLKRVEYACEKAEAYILASQWYCANSHLLKWDDNDALCLALK